MLEENATSRRCPNCQKTVLEGAPACPYCGEKIDVEHPADIKGVRDKPIDLPPAPKETYDRKTG